MKRTRTLNGDRGLATSWKTVDFFLGGIFSQELLVSDKWFKMMPQMILEFCSSMSYLMPLGCTASFVRINQSWLLTKDEKGLLCWPTAQEFGVGSLASCNDWGGEQIGTLLSLVKECTAGDRL